MRFLLTILITLFSISLLLVTQAFAQTQVYVSVSGEQQIKRLTINDASGKVIQSDHVAVGGNPGSLVLHPSGQYLYASIRGDGKIAAMQVAKDGSLFLINEADVDGDPSYVATDPTGKYLVSAYYRAGKVIVHSIGKDGSLSAKPTQTIETDEKAHAVVRDNAGKFVFVPHTGPNAIFQFRWDRTTGKLVPNDPNKLVRTKPKMGPRHLWFHPKLPIAFGSDEQGSSVTSYDFNAARGLLKTRETLSTLPAEFKDRNSTSDIEVHPSGKYVYVANRGHDSIAGFSIDDDGDLAHIGNTPTEKTPRSFNISPDGRYLIAAGQNSGKLALYKIRDDGSLEHFATTDIGSKPWWVLIVQR